MKQREFESTGALEAKRHGRGVERFVGLISDTHGLLRAEAVRALAGAELIVHAGDVGDPEILERLREVAPVVAVRGNVDVEPWCGALPETAVATTEGVLIYALHNLQQLDLNPAAAGFHVVVTGHSHKPARFVRDGVLYVNPGSAGPRRFVLPISVARLTFSSMQNGLVGQNTALAASAARRDAAARCEVEFLDLTANPPKAFSPTPL